MPELRIKKLGLIACQVLWRELTYFAAQSSAEISFFFQPQGLHNDPDKMRRDLQAAIDRIEAEHEFDQLIFGYGLCSRGIEGLKSKKTTMVFPRAHDCLTLLLGSRSRQEQIYCEHPDAYWYSPGWIETGTQPSLERRDRERALLRQKYDEEQSLWLHEQLSGWGKNYHKAIYLDFQIGPREQWIAYTRKCAQELGWQYLELKGDPTLVRNLVNMEWDENNFLIVPAGIELKLSYDDGLMKCRNI